MNMQYSQNGMKLTEGFESCRLTAYHGEKDPPNVWTVGWGHTHNVHEGDTCTQAQADAWLLEDVQNAVNHINHLVTVVLTQQEFDALTDFVFNVGCGAFAGSTLLKLLNAGDYHGAAAQFERWDMANGKHVAGLLRRRVAEEQEFNS